MIRDILLVLLVGVPGALVTGTGSYWLTRLWIHYWRLTR